MNYLVTGGCGFIGSHVLRQLIEQGHTVVSFDRETRDNIAMNEALTPDEIEKVILVQGDLDDRQLLIDTMRKYRIDAIIHLAGLVGKLGEDDPSTAVRINCIGTIHVFEAAVAVGIKRVVWASSSSVYAPEEVYRDLYHTELVPNDALLHPATVYGATKTFNEYIAEIFHERYGLETIGLRYGIVFGVARFRGLAMYVYNLINAVAEGKAVEVDAGHTTPCWIYVEDAARATIMATQCPAPKSRNFFIGGDMASVAQIRDYILTLLPDAQIKLNPVVVFSSAYNLDESGAEEELGFKYEYSVYEGVHKTINAIRAKRGLPLV